MSTKRIRRTRRTRRTRTSTAKTRRIKSNRRTRRQNFRKRRVNNRKRSRRNLYKGGMPPDAVQAQDMKEREQKEKRKRVYESDYSDHPARSRIRTTIQARVKPPVHEVDPTCIDPHNAYLNSDDCCNKEYKKSQFLEIPKGCRVLGKDADGNKLLEAKKKWSFGQDAPGPNKDKVTYIDVVEDWLGFK